VVTKLRKINSYYMFMHCDVGFRKYNNNNNNNNNKGKVVPVLQVSTTPRRRIGEWMYSSTHSLTSAVDGYEWSASRPGRFTPRERAPGTHWIGGWVGPRAVLEAVV
jgi:hypothetical protein